MRDLIRYRVTLECDDFEQPLIELNKLMDSLLINSNIALFFSRAIVPNTDLVLCDYEEKYETKILKKKGYENSDYIVIFKKINTNLELLRLMKQHGLNLYYINTDIYEDFKNLDNIFNEKDNSKIDYKLYDLTHYKILVYFDIDRTIDISFSSKYFNRNDVLILLETWSESMKVRSINIEELR
jgi:hypothetical protein